MRSQPEQVLFVAAASVQGEDSGVVGRRLADLRSGGDLDPVY
jgi:hypothetical protein